jgi:hypothetical protein
MAPQGQRGSNFHILSSNATFDDLIERAQRSLVRAAARSYEPDHDSEIWWTVQRLAPAVSRRKAYGKT